ncbi:MAG: YjcZ family sporulation protein [Brevibacillus sp.]|nr:YjcZ family sporulation protein [Brevibacillus sp.]
MLLRKTAEGGIRMSGKFNKGFTLALVLFVLLVIVLEVLDN